MAIDEDPAPFEVGWGLRKMDTIVVDSKAVGEWSRSVITPRDQTHVVESSDDLQIELLGAQALAFVSLLFLVFILSSITFLCTYAFLVYF